MVDEKALKQYVSDVLNTMRERDISSSAAQDYINNQLLQSAFERVQTTENNIRKYSRLENMIKNNNVTLRDIVGRRHKNLSENIESAQRAATNQLMDAMFRELTPEDVKYLQDSDHMDEIAQAYDGKKADPIAQKIADKLKRYIDTRTAEMVNSNALPIENIQSDRYLRMVHDRSKLLGQSLRKLTWFRATKPEDVKSAKIAWRESIKPLLNLYETFKNTDAIDLFGQIDDSKVNAALDDIYDNIVTGKKDIFTKAGVLTDLEAQQARKRMFFHWKDMRAFNEYNKNYGHGDLFSALLADMHGSGNSIGMARIFGSVPDQMFDKLIRQSPTKKLSWWDTTENFYKYIRGDLRTAKDPTLATWGSNIRAYTGMARLGGLVISSLTDMNIAASYAARFDVNYGRAMINQLDSVLKQFSGQQQKELANMMHLNIKHHIGYMGKFIDASNLSALTGKLSSHYYRAIGMNAWDQGNRIGVMATISKKLGQESSKSFKSLSPMLQNQLRNFNITENEWRSLRSKTKNGYFSLDNVNNLSHEEVNELWTRSDKSVPRSEYRDMLYRKVFSMLDVAADNAIVTPGAYVQSLLTMGTRSGTLGGEMMRMITQFKGFPLTYIDRVLVGGWKNADTAQAKFLWALQNFGYVLPLSYLSTYFYNAAQGKTMPDSSRLNTTNKIAFWAQIATPGFGVMAQILDPDSQNSNALTQMMTSPSWRLLSNALSMPASLLEGNVKGFKKSASRTVQYMVPGASIPFASPFIKHVLGDKPYLNPGQKLRSWAPRN